MRVSRHTSICCIVCTALLSVSAGYLSLIPTSHDQLPPNAPDVLVIRASC